MLELDDALDQKGLVGLGCQHERLLLCIRCHQEVLQLLYTLSHRCVLLCLVVSVRLVGLKLGVRLPQAILEAARRQGVYPLGMGLAPVARSIEASGEG